MGSFSFNSDSFPFSQSFSRLQRNPLWFFNPLLCLAEPWEDAGCGGHREPSLWTAPRRWTDPTALVWQETHQGWDSWVLSPNGQKGGTKGKREASSRWSVYRPAFRPRRCSLQLGGQCGGRCQPQAHVQHTGPACDLPMSDESRGGESPAVCVTFGELAFVFDINILSYCSSPGMVVATELPGFDNSCKRLIYPERTGLISYSHNRRIVCMCWEGSTVSKWAGQWSRSHWTWLLVPQLPRDYLMASSKSLHLPMAQFNYCEAEIKVLTLGKVHTATSISRGYGRLYQYYYHSMHKENNRQN